MTQLPEFFINLPDYLERQKLAETHLRDARKKGLVGITQTQHGLLHLYYNANNKRCRLVQCGIEPKILAEGKKAIVKPILAQTYTDDTHDS